VPTYAYACKVCDHRFEAQQAFSDPSLTECPECSGTLRKLFNSVGIVFKGSGFYRNDSRGGAPSEGSDGGTGDAKSADGKGTESKGSDGKGSDGKGSEGAAKAPDGAAAGAKGSGTNGSGSTGSNGSGSGSSGGSSGSPAAKPSSAPAV
jgi:putative FmdB family regulatory protein